LPIDVWVQVGLIFATMALATVSVVLGLDTGIKRLSEINIVLAMLLLLLILLTGPTALLLAGTLQNFGAYVAGLVPRTLDMYVYEPTDWFGGWTIFYWGWWLAWTPFVALFVARISRGRTIREFILGVLFAPTLVVIIWMSVFGGTAISAELAQAGSISTAAAQDYSLAMAATIKTLPFAELHAGLFLIVSFLLFTWLITSLDSATLVICHILNFDLIVGMKVLWGFMLSAVAGTLLIIGGTEALQAASIIIGLPMAFVMLMVVAALARWVLGHR